MPKCSRQLHPLDGIFQHFQARRSTKQLVKLAINVQYLDRAANPSGIADDANVGAIAGEAVDHLLVAGFVVKMAQDADAGVAGR